MKTKGDIDDFLKALFQREAGGKDHTVVNYAGYVGKYQFGESALIDLGYYTADGTNNNDWSGKWKGKNGIDNLQAFLNNKAEQDVAAKEWVALLCKRMRIFKLDAYIGQTIKGIEITDSGLIAGAHLKGFGSEKSPGVRQFLKSNGDTDPKDGLGTTVSHYIELFAGYDVGCCKRACLAFAEKKTGAPISGMKVQIKKNGKIHKTARTDESGLIVSLYAFNPGDGIEVLVERMAGGYKSLKKSVMQDMNLMMAFVSPKAKATIVTEAHKGAAQPRPAKAATSTPAKNASAAAVDCASKAPAFDTLDALEKVWRRMTLHQAAGSNTFKAKESQTPGKTLKQNIAPCAVKQGRNTKGHPVATVKNEDQASPKKIAAPMEKNIPGLLFPLEKRPIESYKTDARRFGSNRSQGKRKHAGIDLYAPVGTPVRAMADGLVIQSYLFYGGTHVIEVNHGTFIARYGEIAEESISIKDKEEIKRGQIIGKVGQLKGLDISMLHLEMYGTTESPEKSGLTQRHSEPFQRRTDLIDPTESIDQAVME